MSEELWCPRRANSGIAFPGPDSWRDDNSCSFCGCFNPDALMVRLEAGDVELGPTDKNYKVYLENADGDPFKQTYRNCPSGSCCSFNDCTHWVTRSVEMTKFYFQHFSVEQQKRFVVLLNEKKLMIGEPGHFYVRPFFIAR